MRAWGQRPRLELVAVAVMSLLLSLLLPAAPAQALANTWATRAAMPTARSGMGLAAAADGSLYAIGGINGVPLTTVEQYDPATNAWTPRAPLPTARYLLGAAAAPNGKLYAIGGYNGGYLATVEEYD